MMILNDIKGMLILSKVKNRLMHAIHFLNVQEIQETIPSWINFDD